MNGKVEHNTNSKQRIRKIVLLSGSAIILVAGLIMFYYYLRVTRRVIDLGNKKSEIFYIYTGSDFTAVRDSLLKSGILTDQAAFEWLAQKKRYPGNIKPGRYRLLNGMRNNELVNLLRSGNQEPVRMIIQQVNTSAELAGRIGRRLEIDSIEIITKFRDRTFLLQYGLTSSTILTLFIPDTYEFYWNVKLEQFLDQMHKEQKQFWNSERKRLARLINLTIPEVVTLASIVEKETNKQDEKPVIAGVYLNRLRTRIPLQADPTVIYAWHDYTIRRVMKYHTLIKSPYNTYYVSGLPPGPICLPSVGSIDAVLHAQRHAYLYFCAREDLSGYHNFAADIESHNRNARKFQKALDKMKIR